MRTPYIVPGPPASERGPTSVASTRARVDPTGVASRPRWGNASSP
jgi:hypothetical protein